MDNAQAQPQAQNQTPTPPTTPGSFPDAMDFHPKPIKIDPSNPELAPKPKKSKKRLILGIVISFIVLLIGGGIATYFFLNRPLICEQKYTTESLTWEITAKTRFKLFHMTDTQYELIITAPEGTRIPDNAIDFAKKHIRKEEGISEPVGTRMSDNKIRITMSQEYTDQSKGKGANRSQMKTTLEKFSLPTEYVSNFSTTCH